MNKTKLKVMSSLLMFTLLITLFTGMSGMGVKAETNSKYLQIYKAYIDRDKELSGWEDGDGYEGQFIYLDSDKIPELIVIKNPVNHLSDGETRLLRIYKGKVIMKL